MSRGWLAGLVLGVYVLGLVVMAPASLIDSGLEQATEGRLRLADARGTLWSGTGQLDLRDRMQRASVALTIAWRLLPLYFLRGQLRGEVIPGEAAKPFPVAISLSQIEVADADIRLPAVALSLAEPKLAPLGLTGDVLLHIARLVLGRKAIEGSATLQWRGAGSAFTPISPLGDYELRLESEGATVHAALRTLQGPILLDGNGSWTKGANPTYLVTAHIAPEQRQQLAPLMRMIAVERSEGQFELQIK